MVEAIFFFLIPDVAISLVALFGVKRGLKAAGAALVGSLLGGLAMYGIAAATGPQLMPAFDWIPGISPPMIERVGRELDEVGTRAVVTAPLTGTPYKLYAADSGAEGTSLAALLFWTVPARSLRFFPVALLFGAGATVLRRRGLATRPLLWGHGAIWLAIYLAYFNRVGW